jgi:hypothetical protein
MLFNAFGLPGIVTLNKITETFFHSYFSSFPFNDTYHSNMGSSKDLRFKAPKKKKK